MWEEWKDEDDPEPWRGFRAGVDLRYLGAIVQSIREREREKFRIGKKEITYTWKMHEHVTWEFKNIMGKTQSKPNSTQQQ